MTESHRSPAHAQLASGAHAAEVVPPISAITRALVEQLRNLWPAILALMGFAAAAIGVALAIGLTKDVPLSHLTRDPVHVLKGPFYIGLMSNLGVLLWTTAAAVSLFTAALLHRMDPRRELTIFFLFSGLLGVMLTLDDLFTLHEGVLPGSLGIPEKVVYAGYFLSIAGYLVVFSRRILTTRFLLLALALSFFGGSILMDMLLPFSPAQTFVEDAFKFIGIVFWTAYFLDTGFTAVRRAPALR